MSPPQARKPRRVFRTVARPLDMLAFLLPLILYYEIASLARRDQLIAFETLRQFFNLFGHVGMWAPGLAVVVILLTTHVVSRDAWVVKWRRVGWMYVESLVLALPLLLLGWAVRLSAGSGSTALWDQLALGIGAGIYEELVFRLILISLVLIVGADVLKFPTRSVALVAIALSALAFAAHHHRPIGAEPFEAVRFLFRALAGAYLAAVFWFRGYAAAAGTHAAYNVLLILLAGTGR